MTRRRVVVVGGGYGGVSAARLLDEVAEVVLVEPKESFVHVVAALRAAVDPAWVDRVFYPYDHLLHRGSVVHESAKLVTEQGVQLSATSAIEADYIVLATGTAYPFPAKYAEISAPVAKDRIARTHAALADATSVLLVGAGSVGLELAGEITSAFPNLKVTMVEQEDDILPAGDYLPELRTLLREQLLGRDVELVLGSRLGSLPPNDVGVLGRFTVPTTSGTEVSADLWFRCYGSHPTTDYLSGPLRHALRGDGHLTVDRTLRVAGSPSVFAVGDITDVVETKRADAATRHGEAVAANIAALIDGGSPPVQYRPAPERIVLPLGPHGGASQLLDEAGAAVVHGAEETSRFKGADLLSDWVSAFTKAP